MSLRLRGCEWGWGEPHDLRGRHPAFLLGPEGAFVNGSDLLIDGGVIASIAAGRYQHAMS
jgi:hypothetical protein